MAGLFGSGKSVVNEQERISELQVNQATYGEVVPIVFGTTRISGNIIDYFNFTAVRHEESQSAGKGGKTTTTNVTYTYKAAVLVGLVEGPIDGIGRVWKDTDTVTDLTGVNLSLFNGAYGQLPWSYTQSVAPDRALPYSGLAYVAGYIDLNSSAGVPTFNFELMGLLRSSGDGTDCNPADVIAYVMSDRYNGMGMSASDIDAACLQVLRTYSAAADLLISLPATDQTPGYEIANTLCEALNCIVFCGQDGLKIIPRCDEAVTGNGVTYTPDLTPLYDLDEDDFIADDDGRHVRFERTDNADTYNQCQVEFINRSNSYETEKTDYQVASDVNRRGLRPMTRTYHFFHTKSRAAHVAQIQATKSCFNRLTYLFRLGESHCLLEPGDLVTLTTKYGPDKLDRVLVRIETFKELQDEEGYDVTATPVISGTYSPAKYATYEADRAYIDYNVDPSTVNDPVIFEPPTQLTGNSLQTWIGISGAANSIWGGCSVWISDDNATYKKIGTITSAARHGVISTPLLPGESIDGSNTLSVELYRGELLGGTQSDAENLNTLCYVDGELMAYQTATLTRALHYNLGYLIRGAYQTDITSHLAGSKFLRLDDAVWRHTFNSDMDGRQVYFKFTSFNIFGNNEQNLSDVEAYPHLISANRPPDVTGFVGIQVDGDVYLQWSAVDVVGANYDIREGDSWDSGTKIASGLAGISYSLPVYGGLRRNFMIKARDFNGLYSKNAAAVTLEMSVPNGETDLITLDEFTATEAGMINTMRLDGTVYLDNLADLTGKDYLDQYQTEYLDSFTSAARIQLTLNTFLSFVHPSLGIYDNQDGSAQVGIYQSQVYDIGKMVDPTATDAAMLVSFINGAFPLYSRGGSDANVKVKITPEIQYALQSADTSVQFQFRYSADNIRWSDWHELRPFYGELRFVQFLMTLRTNDLTKTPVVYAFKNRISYYTQKE